MGRTIARVPLIVAVLASSITCKSEPPQPWPDLDVAVPPFLQGNKVYLAEKNPVRPPNIRFWATDESNKQHYVLTAFPNRYTEGIRLFHGAGDQLVRIIAWTPQKLSKKDVELLESWRASAQRDVPTPGRHIYSSG